MAFNDIYRLRIYQRLHGGVVCNVMHFVEDAPFTGSGAQDLADDFRDHMLAPLQARASYELTFEYVEVQSIVPFANQAAVAIWPASSEGDGTGACMSGTLAEVITIYTSRAGRRGRGRIYLGGADTVQMSHRGGLWHQLQSEKTGALATALATRYMQVPYVTSWALGVWSRATAGPQPPWPTDAFVRANALTVRTTIRNQRRRQLGVGR